MEKDTVLKPHLLNSQIKSKIYIIKSFFSSVLINVILLYSALIVKRNLSWYLINDLVSNSAAKNLPSQINSIIKDLGNYSMEICEGFGIPEHVVKAPIYTGYEKYYQVEQTNGEHYDVALRPKF
jgi:hypothetical protein